MAKPTTVQELDDLLTRMSEGGAPKEDMQTVADDFKARFKKQKTIGTEINANVSKNITNAPQVADKAPQFGPDGMRILDDEAGFFEKLKFYLGSAGFAQQGKGKIGEKLVEASQGREEKLKAGEFDETETFGEDIQKSMALFEGGIKKTITGLERIVTEGAEGFTDEEKPLLETAKGITEGFLELVPGITQGMFSYIPALLPDFAEKPLESIFGFVADKSDDAIVKAIELVGGDPEDEFAMKLRETAQTVGQLGFGKGVQVAGSKLMKTGPVKTFILKVEDALKRQKQRIAEEAVRPKFTEKEIKERVQKGQVDEPGLFTKGKVQLNQFEKDVATELNTVPEFKEGLDPIKTTKVINKYIKETKGPELRKSLEENNAIFNQKELDSQLWKKVEKGIEEHPTLTGDAKTSAVKILNQYKKILASKKNNVLSAWEARVELDTWAKSLDINIFDKTTGSAVGLDIVRTAVNEFINEKAQNANVQAQLDSMSKLYRATEMIATKKNMLPYIQQAVRSIGATLGMTGIAAGAVGFALSPTIISGITAAIATGAATIKAGKLILSPAMKELVIKELKKANPPTVISPQDKEK